jgi:GNAT superfamily N-acetyltransferase
MKIDTATTKDLQDILELNKQLFEFESQFTDSYNTNWPNSESGQLYFLKRIESGIVLLAKEKDNLTGYICGYVYNFPARTPESVAEIENMFVKPEYRNKKVGTKLFEAFQTIAKQKGAGILRVGAIAGNQNALEFYKNKGLELHEVILEKNL